jgi:hypothetical protein
MNRIVVAALLALVAIGAGSVWAIGQFGGSANPVVSEPREPIVREPEIAAAIEPAAVQPNTAKPAHAKPTPAMPTTTTSKAEPKVDPKIDPAPAAVTDPFVAPPAVETPVTPSKPVSPLDKLKARVEKEIDKVKPATPSTTPSTSLAPPTPPSGEPLATPATPAVTPAPAEPSVSTQAVQAPAKPSARATPAQDTVLPASVPGVTQTAAPVGLEAQFKSRRVTYNRPPQKLALNKPVDVSLVVNATADADAGKAALEGFKGEIIERDVDLSDTVSAQLTGAGFDITSQTVDRQRLSGRAVNRWQWRVTPTETGEHTLMLEIFGYATGSLDAEPLDAYRDVIAVEVEQFDALVSWAKGVQPLFAVLAAMAGVGSAIFAFLRFREEKKQTKAGAGKSE